MLYHLYETQRALMAPFSEFASASAKLYDHPLSPFAHLPLSQRWSAGFDLLHRDCVNVCDWFTRQRLECDAEELFAELGLEPLDGQHGIRGDAVLLAAGADHCVGHGRARAFGVRCF